MKSAIDEMLSAGASFDEELHEELFNKYLARSLDSEEKEKMDMEMKTIVDANTASREIMTPIIRKLDGVSQDNTRYGDRVYNIAEHLDGTVDTSALQSVVETLARETTKIARENRKISAELDASSKRLAELKSKLEDARASARTDTLTKLQNRMAFNEKLAETLRKIRRGGHKASLALADIDHFKRINDTYGHPIGDKALVAIAGLLEESLGSTDLVYRYGGEEFMILMLNTSLEQAMERLEKTRHTISGHEFVARGVVEHITISIGVGKLGGNRTAGSNTRHVDDAMYLAKQSGRNNIKSETEPGGETAGK